MFRLTVVSTVLLTLCHAAHALVQAESQSTKAQESAPAPDDASAQHRTEQIRRYDFTTAPVGRFSIEIVGDELRHATLNGRVFPKDRIRWDALDRTLQFFDETRTRDFSVTLNDDTVDTIHLNTWLQTSHPSLPRKVIGIYTDRVPPALASQLALDPENALIVTGVVDGMPARSSGIQQYDVIVSIESMPNVSDAILKRIVREKKEGQTVRLRLIRHTQPIDLEIPVALVSDVEAPVPTIDLGGPGDMSFSLEEINEAMANDPVFLDFPTTAGEHERRVVIFSRKDIGLFSPPGPPVNADSTRPAGIFSSSGDLEQAFARIEQLEKELALLKAQLAAINRVKQ